jgi:diguanylate cyclase (GGDEF)-like protein
MQLQLPILRRLFQPGPGEPRFRLLIALSGATVALTFLVLVAVLMLSASRSDQISRRRMLRVVEYALTKSVEKVPYDQESVAIWDEALQHVNQSLDLEWIDINLGVWMYDYFKHDRSYVVSADNELLYAMADGKRTSADRSLPAGKIADVVAVLREKIQDGGLDRYEKGEERIPRAVDLGFVDSRPAIVSAMPLVSDTGAITQKRGTESLIVAVRFLDSSFLPDLAAAYLLKGVRLSRENDTATNELSYPLRDVAGAPVGYFIWQPELPGSTILRDLAPLFALGALAIGVAVTFLVRSLRHTYTELVVSEAHSKHLAYHDALTGLPNRAYFNDRLEETLGEVRDGRGQAALMFLDLDRFKEVNDTFGHAVGDALIREVTAQLNALLSDGDILARMGGDEFALIKANTSKAEVESFGRLISATCERPFDIDGLKVLVGVSIGIAMAPEASTDRSELARKADIALYQAKKSTTARVQFFSEEMGQRIEARRALEMELREALATGSGLEVAYQPIYAVDGVRLSGAEALARWEHPRLGSIPPSVFVALAEECGLIDQLGDWVLRKSCQTAKALRLSTIAVNVSTVQCQRPDYAQRVFEILNECELAPGCLEIEITESVLLDGSGTSTRTLKTLRDGDVRIALDDFGTGYSSLSYLLKLEVDRIKIDRSFVQQLDAAQSRSIIRAIVTMAKAVDVAVTAEGVETQSQLVFLAEAGCDHLQGYLLAKPISALQLAELLRAEVPMLARVMLAPQRGSVA